MSATLRNAALIAAALALLPSPGAAQTRPGGAIGYSAAERRVVDARLVRMEAAHGALASRLGLSRQLVRAIAAEVGLANSRFTDAQLIAAVEAMASRAVEIQRENRRLREEVARLRDPALRDPALGLLTRAEAALEEGRLADAEALYGEIRTLRWDESRAAEEAWTAALEAEVRTAELQQNFVRAQDIRLEASDRFLARSEADHHRAFEQADQAAQLRLDEGQIFGRPEALSAAIALWRTRVLPMVPAAQYPLQHAWAQTNLGNALRTMGERTAGQAGIDALIEAESLFRDAIRAFESRSVPIAWAAAQHNLANALMTRSKRDSYATADRLQMIDQAIIAFRAALTVRTAQGASREWGMSQNGLAAALMARGVLGEREDAAALLAEAVAAYRSLLLAQSQSANPVGWGHAQHNLGIALSFQAELSTGRDALILYTQAISAFQFALEVRPRDQSPYLWAMTQSSMALSYERMARLTSGPDRLDFLRLSQQTYQGSLLVFDASGDTVQQAQNRAGLARVSRALAESL